MLHRCLGFLLAMSLVGAQGVNPAAGTNQQQNPSVKRYPVSGSVVNPLTGAPVPRAVVRLLGPEPTQAFTDENGHFELKDVPEGRVNLSAQRPGFQVSGRDLQKQVTVDQTTSTVQLKLTPQSSLRGRVLNNEGEPIEGVQVQMLRRQIMAGMPEWLPANTAMTDEAGNFVVEDLPPGTYLLHTHPHRLFSAVLTTVVNGRHLPDLYPSQYYPNAPDRASAQPIQIQPGVEAQTDLTLTPVPSYTASGTIGNVRNFVLTCDTPEGENVSGSFRMERDGHFVMTQLPSGPCTIHARTGMRGTDAAYAELPITVGSTDLTGLQLNLEPLPDVTVVFSGLENYGSNSGAPPGINLQLIPHPQRFIARAMPQLIRKGNEQVFTGVAPGTYRVNPQVSGPNCLASVSSGSIDLLRSDLTVSAGGAPAPIEVAVRKDCGSITAKVEGANATDSMSFLLVPEAAPSQGKLMYGTGGVQIPNLTPGDYTIFAGPDLTDIPYADAEAMKGFEGQKVSVGPNAQVNVQLQPMAGRSEGR